MKSQRCENNEDSLAPEETPHGYTESKNDIYIRKSENDINHMDISIEVNVRCNNTMANTFRQEMWLFRNNEDFDETYR